LVIDYLDSNKIKISSSVDDSFLLLVRNTDNTKVSLEYHQNNGSGANALEIYKFILRQENGNLQVMNPRVSLLTIASGSNNNLKVSFESCICGSILMHQSEAQTEISNSIIDGKGSDISLVCYQANVTNSTLFGKMTCEILHMASNSIFTDIVFVKRRQSGCVRFSYILPDSQTPKRYRCVPEYYKPTEALLNDQDLSPSPIVRFTDIVYPFPGYGQLHKKIAPQILQGGDNGSEMGVFNNQFLPQRIKNLKSACDEYLPIRMESGVLLVT
jgi:hypothetical protein